MLAKTFGYGWVYLISTDSLVSHIRLVSSNAEAYKKSLDLIT